MHIIIPLKDFSIHDNIELRYCLRSIEKYIQDYDAIYLITKALPKWVKGVRHIEVCDEQKYGHVAFNIDNKINFAMTSIEADNVLLMSDDYFLTETIDAKKVSYHNKGLLSTNILKRNQNESYTRTLINTFSFLFERNESTNDCDLHYPITLNKRMFYSIKQPVLWPVHGYSIRSLYVNLNNIETVFMEDNKIKKASEFKEDMKFFSTTDSYIDKDMKALFEWLYPLKSKYEK